MTHDWDQHHARPTHGHDHGHGHGHGHDHGTRHVHGHDRDASAASTSSAELAGFLAGCAQLPRRAVDLGCGTGADAVYLAEQGIETIGVDMSATGLDQARDRAELHGVQVQWLQDDVLQLSLDDGSVDLALDRGCLHHLSDADQGRYAIEVARVLRPGGTLLVREMNQPGHDAHAVSENSLRTMVEDTPLRVRSIVRYETTHGERTVRTMFAVIDRD